MSREATLTPPDPTTKTGANIQLPAVAVYAIAQTLAETVGEGTDPEPSRTAEGVARGHATGHAKLDEA